MNRILAFPIVEELASADPAGVPFARFTVRRRSARTALGGDEVPFMARRFLRREENLEAAVVRYLDVRRVEPAGLDLHSRLQLGQTPGVACDATIG